MKTTATKTGVTLKLDTREALLLAAFVGEFTESRGFIPGLYDALADAIEAPTQQVNPDTGFEYVTTVSHQIEAAEGVRQIVDETLRLYVARATS